MEKRVLRELYQKYGETVILDPRKLKAYLLDMRLPKKSVNLLVDISKTDYFRRFQAEIANEPEAREKLIYAIDDEYAFDKNAAEFGADCWVYALTGRGQASKSAAKRPKEDLADALQDDNAELMAAALRRLMSEM